jgi:hypothetical protein
MPENGKSTEPTFHANSPHSTIMAIAKVGDGPSRTIANSSRKDSQLCCRLFTKWVEAKTTREHQSTNNSEVLLAEHNLQIWSS